MKMVAGSGSITDYPNWVFNCTLGQYNYKIPTNGLNGFGMMLYIDVGGSAPGSATYELIHTCGANAGTVETLTPADYVIGQDTNQRYYMVINGFVETTTAPCFVIAVTLDSQIYFSQEYCDFNLLTPCGAQAGLIQGCYGNLDPLISYDREGIYFGQSQGGTQGNADLVYQHMALMYDPEVTLNAIKNEFKSGRTRNFRTESVDIFQFWGDAIPEWYIRHIDAIFKRGEVYILARSSFGSGFIADDESDSGLGKKFKVNSTAYEKVDECVKAWKPTVLLEESQYQSFSCEPDPCVVVEDGSGGGETPTPCCDPSVISADIEFDEGNIIILNFTPCEPAPTNGYTVLYRLVGSGGGYTVAGTFTSSPAVFGVGGSDGDQYEGYIYSDCGDGTLGNNIIWSTSGASESPYTLQLVSPCAAGYSPFIVSGGTVGDSVVIRTTFSGNMARTGGAFVRADLLVRSPYITDPPTFSPIPEDSDSSTCYVDTIGHGFNIVIDITIIMPAGDATFDVTAIVNNTNPVIPKGVLVEIISVNGGGVSGISQIGCAGTASTGGTC